jgi:hypothetical protein
VNDSQLIDVLKRIDRHQQIIRDLMDTIYDSDHPGAEATYDALLQNEFGNAASAQACGFDHLNLPERWDLLGGGTIYRKRRA